MTIRTASALFCFVFCSLSFACGSEEAARSNTNNGKKRPANSNEVASGGAPTPAGADPALTAANSTPENPISALRNKKLENIRAAGGDPAAPKPDIEAVLKSSERSAPENSLFSFALIDDLVERRTFPQHPILSKVEKVTGNDGRSSIKVLTKDGRLFELEGNAIGPVSTAATVTILRAIGLEVPAVDRKPRSAPPATKN